MKRWWLIEGVRRIREMQTTEGRALGGSTSQTDKSGGRDGMGWGPVRVREGAGGPFKAFTAFCLALPVNGGSNQGPARRSAAKKGETGRRAGAIAAGVQDRCCSRPWSATADGRASVHRTGRTAGTCAVYIQTHHDKHGARPKPSGDEGSCGDRRHRAGKGKGNLHLRLQLL